MFRQYTVLLQHRNHNPEDTVRLACTFHSAALRYLQISGYSIVAFSQTSKIQPRINASGVLRGLLPPSLCDPSPKPVSSPTPHSIGCMDEEPLTSGLSVQPRLGFVLLREYSDMYILAILYSIHAASSRALRSPKLYHVSGLVPFSLPKTSARMVPGPVCIFTDGRTNGFPECPP
ncbi:hypothetical protein BCR34DRAFT_288397 [Clohesyomyces aquaticus]|uniref:Uncharacterized protein n=1 Tax=Clohesyomyces aquaticus TaxID=1231657 RepID=A0A1Y1ZR70_9PLEO|nr:hypothetical protein BCR34DRAFT_288397 [Clohesyomyces aquaticus]